MISVPIRHQHDDAHRRLLAEAINQLIPVIKSVVLTTSSATTTVTDDKMGTSKTVILLPTDVGASTEDWYISSKLNGSFVITHANNGTTRTFDYVIIN